MDAASAHHACQRLVGNDQARRLPDGSGRIFRSIGTDLVAARGYRCSCLAERGNTGADPRSYRSALGQWQAQTPFAAVRG